MVQRAKARFSLEFAALTAVVCFALVAMKTYMTRSFQGRFRELADNIGQQYDPQATTSNSTVITRQLSQEYMLYDTSGNGDPEYLGTAVMSVSNQDVYSTERVSSAATGGTTSSSSGGPW